MLVKLQLKEYLPEGSSELNRILRKLGKGLLLHSAGRGKKTNI